MKFKILVFISAFAAITFAQLDNNLFRLAKSYEQAGQFEKAKNIYQKLYEKDTNSYQVFDALNHTYIQLKEYDSSIQLIESRLEKTPQDVNLYGMLGSTYYLQGNEEKAFEVWDNSLKKIPSNETSYRTLSNYAVQRRAFKKAAEYLRLGRNIAEEPKYFSYDLANIYSLTMQFKEAAEEYCRVLSNEPNQLSYIQSRIFNYINKPDALKQTIQVVEEHLNENISFNYLLANLYVQDKSYEKALEIYRNIDAKQNNGGVELYNFAQIMFNEEQYELASEVYNEILNKYPSSPLISSAKLGFARTLEESFKKNNPLNQDWKPYYLPFSDKNNSGEKVVSAYLDLAKAYPHSEMAYEAYLQIGRIKMYRQNKPDEAQNYYKTIIEESPLSRFAAAAYAELGRIFLMKNDLEKAKLNYSKIVKRSNGSPANKNYAYFQLAKINFFQNNFDTASKILNNILNDLDDNSANDAIELSLILNTSKKDSSNLVIFASAELLAEQAKFSEASEKYKLIASNQQAFILQDISQLRRAEMELALDEIDSALSLLQKIADEKEQNIYADKALYLQGKIYEFGLNNTEKAVEIYEKLLAKFPNSLYLDEARSKIIKLRKTS